MPYSTQQQAVLTWAVEGQGSLELLARAGCGKTFTLMALVDTIREHDLGDVLLMAYNTSIAGELKAKLAAKGIDWKQAEAATVHSIGMRVWRKVAPNVQVDEKKVYKIIEGKVNPDAHRDVYRDHAPMIAKLVSYAKGEALGHLASFDDRANWQRLWDHHGMDEDLAEQFEGASDVQAMAIDIMRAAVCVYKASLNTCREVIDFDDMILAPLYFRARFWPKAWVMLDEAQDTNPARRALALAMLKPVTGRLVFVGDDRQAIYGWTGASSDSMAQLKRATAAVTLPLNTTYRCAKSIVAMAQTIVPDITAHEDNGKGVVRSIKDDELAAQKLCASDAILCRNNAPLVSTAYSLLSQGIACKIEGRDIGQGLVKLARKWKVTKLEALVAKLDDFEERETAKLMSQDKEHALASLTDKLECLRIIIERCQLKQQYTVNELVAEINRMFGADLKTGESPKVCTLSSIHKSKGREWKRVFILGRKRYMPSPFAKKDWQLVQESNLAYVAITRAEHELVDVEV